MKTILSIFIIFLLLVACSNKKRPEGFVPELEFSIPKDLKKYPEVSAFLKESYESLNMQTFLLEEKAALCKPFIDKENATLTESERADLGASMMNFLDEYGKYIMALSELELLGTSMAESVDEEHRDLVEESVEKLSDYGNLVKDKYQDYGISKDDLETVK